MRYLLLILLAGCATNKPTTTEWREICEPTTTIPYKRCYSVPVERPHRDPQFDGIRCHR